MVCPIPYGDHNKYRFNGIIMYNNSYAVTKIPKKIRIPNPEMSTTNLWKSHYYTDQANQVYLQQAKKTRYIPMLTARFRLPNALYKNICTTQRMHLVRLHKVHE